MMTRQLRNCDLNQKSPTKESFTCYCYIMTSCSVFCWTWSVPLSLLKITAVAVNHINLHLILGDIWPLSFSASKALSLVWHVLLLNSERNGYICQQSNSTVQLSKLTP